MKIPLVIIDTNVLISAITTKNTPPAKLLNLWKRNKIQLVLPNSVIMELENVLQRPYFKRKIGWENQQIRRYSKNLRKSSLVYQGKVAVDISRDPEDNMLFSCALESGVDFIVSGDKDVLVVKNFRGTQVLTPKEFLQQITTT